MFSLKVERHFIHHSNPTFYHSNPINPCCYLRIILCMRFVYCANDSDSTIFPCHSRLIYPVGFCARLCVTYVVME